MFPVLFLFPVLFPVFGLCFHVCTPCYPFFLARVYESNIPPPRGGGGVYATQAEI